jgi:hypothetical protein
MCRYWEGMVCYIPSYKNVIETRSRPAKMDCSRDAVGARGILSIRHVRLRHYRRLHSNSMLGRARDPERIDLLSQAIN